MRRVLSVVIALLPSLSWGLAGGINLNERIQQNDPKAKIYSNLLQATGHLTLINSDPVTEENVLGKDGYSLIPYKIGSCSAVYIRQPAYFVTSARCFADKEGKLDRNRQLGKIFVGGKGYLIDPSSIVLHENYEKFPNTDFAIFSLEAQEAVEFAESHTPLDVATENIGMTGGKSSFAVGYGLLAQRETLYGYARGKELIERNPSPDEVKASGGKLFNEPTQHLLMYQALERGINCSGDAGGPVVMVEKRTNKATVVALMLGHVGPDGELRVACEMVNRYLVAGDLRPQAKWIDKAIEQSEQLMNEAGLATKTFDRAAQLELARRKSRELLSPIHAGRTGWTPFYNSKN